MEGDLSEKGKSIAADSKVLGLHRKTWPSRILLEMGDSMIVYVTVSQYFLFFFLIFFRLHTLGLT